MSRLSAMVVATATAAGIVCAAGVVCATPAAGAPTDSRPTRQAVADYRYIAAYPDRETCRRAGRDGQAAGRWSQWYCVSDDWGSERQALWALIP
ncbi:hypothetical protein [Thermomonospora umbrina]|nr:hypothetical protein [Thermomonospora umbrina]